MHFSLLSRLGLKKARREPERIPGADEVFPGSPLRIRYNLEYHVLPMFFAQLSPDVLASEDIAARIEDMCRQAFLSSQQDCPYRNLQVGYMRTDDQTELFRMELPEPEAEKLCYRFYFVRNIPQSIMACFLFTRIPKRRKTGVWAIVFREEPRLMYLDEFPLYLPGDTGTDFDNMIAAESVIVLNMIGKTWHAT